MLVDPFANVQLKPTSEFRDAYRDYEKGNQVEARSTFLKILRKTPKNYAADLAVGYTYLAEANFDLAERYTKQAIDQSPDYAQAHFALALVSEGRQDYDSALASLEQVSQINQDYPNLRQTRNILKLKATELHLSEGKRLAETDQNEAVRHLLAAQKLAPEIPEIPFQIAEVYLKKNQCEQAVPYLEQADKTLKDNIDVKTRLFNCYADLQQYEQALATYSELVVLKPADPEIQKRAQNVKRILAQRALPDEYQSIPTSDQITRGQLAAYLWLNLESLKRYGAEGPSNIIVDTLDYWAKSEIQRVVDLGIMDLFPNRTFQPEHPITKMELARAASRILEILEASKSVTGPSATETEIPDLPPGSVYYQLVMKPLAAGVISLDNDGRFNGSRPVTGAELISMVNRFQALMERS